MKRLILATFTALMVATLPLMADSFSFFTGAEGGGYHRKSMALAERFQQRGIEVAIVNRNGSDDITLQACSNPNSIWIAQHDAVWKRELEGCRLVDIAVHGVEHAFLLVPPDSKIDRLRDLTSEHTVLVDRVGSGSELTWNAMRTVEEKESPRSTWIAARQDNSQAALAVSRASRSTIDAVFLVRDQRSPDVLNLLKAGWSMAEMWSRSIERFKWGNKAMYPSQQLTINFEGQRHRNYVFDVTTFIGTTSQIELQSDVFNRLVNTVN
jgi:TRAP-type uncharacterized transport system substrate-binding protein